MIDGLKPYPAMKDSGVPWLGPLPQHWDIYKLKRIARLQSGAGITAFNINEQGKYPVFGGNGLRGYTSAFTHDGEYVLIGRQGALCGNINYAKGRFWASEHAVVAHPRRPFTVRWLGELLRIMNLNQYSISAAQPGLSVERIEPLPIPYPPFDEQRAIARFLGYGDRLIRRHVAAKRKLIKSLEEQKQAVIQRVVTRGLDPNVRLKPSGAEWLGNVPEHWTVRRLKTLFREIDDRSDMGTEVLLSLRMHRGLVPHTEVSKVPITSEALIGFKRCRPGQLVMNRMRAAIGMFGVARQSGLVSPDYAVFNPREPINEDFILNLLITPAMRTVFRIESKGLGTGSSGFMRLYSDRFGIIKIALPPLSEQEAIVRHLDVALADLSGSIDRTNREISLLQEFRTRLIADVVTGKLDVRAAAAALPDAVEDAEAVDAIEEMDPEEEAADGEIEPNEAAA